MSAQARPTSKPMSKQFADNYDKIFKKKEVPIGEDTRPKDRVKQGISGHCVIENINSKDLL